MNECYIDCYITYEFFAIYKMYHPYIDVVKCRVHFLVPYHVYLVHHHVSHSGELVALEGQQVGHRYQGLSLMLPSSTGI